MNSYYENHIRIRQNKLCPFKLQKSFDTNAVPCNWHKNIEIILVTDGVGSIQYSADILKVTAGDMVIINSGALHRPYSDVGIGYYYLIIDDSFCAENGIDVTSFTFDRKFRDARTLALFQSVIRCMKEYDDAPNTTSVLNARIAVLSLLSDICGNYAVPTEKGDITGSSSEKYVKQVIEHINKSFSEPLCLESLATLCGVSKYHLAREFKRLTGQTVFSYLNTVRCQNAEHFICGGMSVTEAACAGGFNSLSYFSRTYKKKMGKVPSNNKQTNENPPLDT